MSRRINEPANAGIDLNPLLNPIVDASHTRNRCISPPNSACLPGTRQRVLQDVHSWVNSSFKDGHIMWIYGFAGCGKSAIAQEVAEHFDRERQLAAAFFFFRGSGDRSRTSRFATTIASQMARAFPATASYIKDSLEKDPGLLFSTTPLTAQCSGLVYGPIKATVSGWDRLVALLGNKLKPFLIVLDGLDECEDREEIAVFIEHMIDFFDANPRIPLRFLITSRVEEHIHRRLYSSNQVLLLNLVDRTSDADIATALDAAIFRAKHSRVLGYDESWPSAEDKARLVTHVGGSFIFFTTVVKFLFDPDLQDGRTPMSRLHIILNTKPDFDGAYQAIITPQLHIPHFHNVISVIALAQEPLSIAQTSDILKINAVETPVTLWNTSLRDFLTTEARSGHLFASPTYHGRIGCECIRLALSPAQSASRTYSQQYAFKHLYMSPPVSADVFSGVLEGLESHLDEPQFEDGRSALELAIRDRNWELVRAFMKAGVNVNSRFKDGGLKHSKFDTGTGSSNVVSALHAACHHKELNMVYLLLENGADPNIAGPSSNWEATFLYGTPLAFSSYTRNIKLVTHLLACGADPNLQGGFYGTALQAACCGGSLEVVRLLLQYGSNPNTTGGVYHSALHACACRDQVDCARALLEHKAYQDVNLKDTYGSTPLRDACARGHNDVVELLLEFGADPTIRNMHGETAFQRALVRWGEGSDTVLTLRRCGVME